MDPLFDSIRRYAQRSWPDLVGVTATEQDSMLLRLNQCAQLAQHIRENSPGYALAREEDLAHHLEVRRWLELIDAPRLPG